MTLRFLIAVSLFALSSPTARGQAADDSETTPDFVRDVLPVLSSHCGQCHGEDAQEANVRFDNLSTDLINDRIAAETWLDALNAIKSGEMPPEDEPQLSDDQRELLIGCVSAAIQQAIDAQRKTGGRGVLRRLNRVEYQNTMHDLLGLEMDYDRDLPPDAVSPDGFTNNGRSLQMSAMQLEYYLDTARRALERVIVEGPEPKQYEYEFTEDNLKRWFGGVHRSNSLGRQQVFLVTMVDEYPESGDFLVRVTLNAELKPDTGYPLLEVSVGYRPDTKKLFREVDVVEITTSGKHTLEFRGRLENHPLPVRGQGKFPGLVVRCRNLYTDGSPLPNAEKKADKKRGTHFPDEPHLPTLTIEKLEFKGPVFDEWPPQSHRRILFESDLRDTDEAAYVAEVLQRFMSRAYRRPVQQAEVEPMVAFFGSIRPNFPSYEEAIRETLAMVLIRPEFLYLVEPAGKQKRPVTDWELASRLSYFLWSTMPDERLLKLAQEGTLGKAEVLVAEVDRLLNDFRSERFVDQFAEQWLHLNVVDSVAVNPEYYPDFDNALKDDMRTETQQFFGELVQHDLSALKLLSSEFTMLNESLAKHYGIAGVFGQNFRRVAIPSDLHGGGLLGQASILLSNSTGEDSHAVRRAVWIRDRLLNDPPATPPPNVPGLDEAGPEFLKLSIREQLEIHRGDGACASCHRRIDPWGIALENFDAVGLWREEVRRKVGRKFETQAVNAADQLPDGFQVNGVDSLKQYLLAERKNDFARSLVMRLLTYALGRNLELSDRSQIDDLTEKFVSNDYRLRQLIRDIVASESFLTK